MSFSANKVQAPVTMTDIRNATGCAGGVGYIYTTANFDKWNKCKPTEAPVIAFANATERATNFKNNGYSLTMPKCSLSNFKTSYTTEWTYRRPTTYFRMLDMDGYVANNANSNWQLNSSTSTYLRGVFNCRLSVAGTILAAGDYVRMYLQCHDVEDSGLVYPKDFQGTPTTANYTDISSWYAGIALISGDTILVTAPDKLSNHFTETNYTAFVDTSIPSSGLPNGPMVIAPVLVDRLIEGWSSDGVVIGLNGAYLSVTKTTTSPNLTYSVTYTRTSSSVKVDVSITNQTGSAKTYYAYAYLMSYGAYTNEHDGGSYTGPDFQGEGVAAFLHRVASGGTLPPKSGDVYSHDWSGGSTNPDELAARYWQMSSSISIANNQTKTFSKTFSATGDDFGSYSSYMPVLCICAYEGGTIAVRNFDQN